jgi:SNF2 family DNA or RNA helicase
MMNQQEVQAGIQPTFEGHPMIVTSSVNQLKLYPHQRISIAAMEKRERDGFVRITENRIMRGTVGIMGDMVGHGKTLSMVTLMDRDKMEWNLDFPHVLIEIDSMDMSGLYRLETNKYYTRSKTNLLVANQSLLGQWEDEISGNTSLTFKTITTNKHVKDVNPFDFDVILVSSARYNSFAEKYLNIAWKRFIFDEVTSTKIPSMKPSIAGFIWLVSATWDSIGVSSIGNSQHFIRKLFPRSFPYSFLMMLTVRNEDDLISRSARPQEFIEYIIPCLTSLMINAVKNHVSETVAEYLAAGDVPGAIRALGGEKGERIDVILKQRFETQLKECEMWIDTHGPLDKKSEKWISKKSMLIQKITDLEKNIKESLDSDCSICYETIQDPVMCPFCMNMFCGECLLSWVVENETCPLCRSELKPNDVIIVKREESEKESDAPVIHKREEFKQAEQEDEVLYKPESVSRILNQNPGKKFIIFSASSASYTAIKTLLPECTEITGTKKTRENKIEKFRTGESPVIFLHTKSNGAGINLQCADIIILYHVLSDREKVQSIGRANRLGRDPNNILKVYQLFGSVDEMI